MREKAVCPATDYYKMSEDMIESIIMSIFTKLQETEDIYVSTVLIKLCALLASSVQPFIIKNGKVIFDSGSMFWGTNHIALLPDEIAEQENDHVFGLMSFRSNECFDQIPETWEESYEEDDVLYILKDGGWLFDDRDSEILLSYAAQSGVMSEDLDFFQGDIYKRGKDLVIRHSPQSYDWNYESFDYFKFNVLYSFFQSTSPFMRLAMMTLGKKNKRINELKERDKKCQI